jgi:transcriptional regulator of the spore photoproduct lyase operon
MTIEKLHAGDKVYIIQRNPHTQSVAHIQEAYIIDNPYHPGELSLFFRDEYYPLTDDFAMFSSYEEAEEVYRDTFNPNDEELDFNPIHEVYRL